MCSPSYTRTFSCHHGTVLDKEHPWLVWCTICALMWNDFTTYKTAWNVRAAVPIQLHGANPPRMLLSRVLLELYQLNIPPHSPQLCPESSCSQPILRSSGDGSCIRPPFNNSFSSLDCFLFSLSSVRVGA